MIRARVLIVLALAGCNDFDALDRCFHKQCIDSSKSCLVEVKAGWSHTCVRKIDGTVWCFGNNNAMQLGTPSDSGMFRADPQPVSGLAHAVGIAAGDSHSCALASSATADCWGYNNVGELGNGSTAGTVGLMGVPSLSDAREIVAAGESTCVLKNDGTVLCWGDDTYGQVGDGTTTELGRPLATPVTSLSDVMGIAVGWTHACALKSAGTVFCWGDNTDGQLGDGTHNSRSTVSTPAMISDVVQIGAGYHHTCAVKRDGTVWCWGSNETGQLGNGTTTASAIPVQAIGVVAAVEVQMNGNDQLGVVAHTCARTADGSLWCWGSNANFELGDGTTVDRPMPQKVPNVSDAIAVGPGGHHTCIARANSTVSCWGANDKGQLGQGGKNFTSSSVPTQSALACQ